MCPAAEVFGNKRTEGVRCAWYGQRIAKLLLRNKADIFHKNSEGLKASELAYRFNYQELGDYLLEKERIFADQRNWVHYGAVTEGEAAFRDCQHGKYRNVETALEKGVVTVGTQHYHKKNTLLHVAAVNGHMVSGRTGWRTLLRVATDDEFSVCSASLSFAFEKTRR